MQQQFPPLQIPHPSGVDGCSCPHPQPGWPYPCDRKGDSAHPIGNVKRSSEQTIIIIQLGMARQFILDCHTIWGG